MAMRGAEVLACCAGEAFSWVEDQVRIMPGLTGLDRTGGGVVLLRAPSGAICRDQAKGGSYRAVIVGPGVPDVEPINLAAALCVDRTVRRARSPYVILLVEQMTGSLASRAKSAGIDAVVPLYQGDALAHRLALMGVDEQTDSDGITLARPEREPARDAGVESGSRIGVIEAQKVQRGAATAGIPDSGIGMSRLAEACGVSAERRDRPSASGKRASSSRVICIGSGRGGVGKSSISILLALSARARGVPTLLVDLDAQFGDLAYLLGAENPPTVNDAARRMLSGEGVGKLAPEVAGGVGLLAAPDLPEQGDALVDQVAPLLSKLREDFSLVICNLGSTWGDLYAEAMLAADLSLLVMDQRASSVEACRRAFELACRLGVAGPRISFVLNRCSQKGQVTGLDASVALDGARVFELPDGGPAVEDLIAAGCPEELLVQSNPFARGVDDLAGRLMRHLGLAPAERAPKEGRTWLFGRG